MIRFPSRAASLLVALAALTLAGCASSSIERAAFTQQEQAAAQIPGIPGARVWSDERADTYGPANLVGRAVLPPGALPEPQAGPQPRVGEREATGGRHDGLSAYLRSHKLPSRPGHVLAA